MNQGYTNQGQGMTGQPGMGNQGYTNQPTSGVQGGSMNTPTTGTTTTTTQQSELSM